MGALFGSHLDAVEAEEGEWVHHPVAHLAHSSTHRPGPPISSSSSSATTPTLLVVHAFFLHGGQR